MNNTVAKKGIWMLLVVLLHAGITSGQTTFYKAYYRVRFGMNPQFSNTCPKVNFTLETTLRTAGTPAQQFKKSYAFTAPFVNAAATTIIESSIYLPWRPIVFNAFVYTPTWISQDITYNAQADGITWAGEYYHPSPTTVANCQLFLHQAFPMVYQYECTIGNLNPQISYCGDETVPLFLTENPVSVVWEIASDGLNFVPFKTIAGRYLNLSYYDVAGSGVNPDGVLNLRATADYGNGTVMHPAVYTGIQFAKPVPGPTTIVAAPPPCAGDNGTITMSGFQYADGSSYSGAIALQAKFQDVNTGDVYTSPQFTTAAYSMSLPTGTYQLKLTSPSSSCVKDMGNAPAVGAAPPALVLSEPTVSCSAGKPAFTLSALGGTTPYTFSIDNVSNPDGDNIFTGLMPATAYTLWVEDFNHCKAFLSKTTQTAVTATLSDKSDPTAPNAPDGSITVTPGGGAGAPFTYSLDNATWQSSNVFSGLTKGTYSIWVKDTYGCTNATALSVTLQDPLPVNVTVAVTQISCNGQADGSVTVSATGGKPPFTYSRDGVNYLTINNFTNLAVGNYTVWAKDSKGSTASTGLTIIMPPVVSISISNQKDALCKGMANGQIAVTGSGGTGTLQYALNTDPFQASAAFAVPAGSYTVTVMDVNGCSTATPQINIAEPAQAVAITATTTAVNCNGEASGSISVGVSNGVSPYRYQLNGGAWQTNAVFNGLSAGAYTINVEDNNSCPASQSNINITQPPVLTIALDVQTDATCFNATDGSIRVSSAGGTGNVLYYINTAPTVPNSNGIFNGLAAGSYTITAKDEHNCTAVTTTVVIAQPAVLQLTATISPVTCYSNANGKVDLQPAGGTAPYTYSADGITFSSSTTFNNLPAGSYTYYIKDSHNCTASIPVTVTQPTVLSFTMAISNALCQGSATGTITVTAAGGTGAWQYNVDGNPFQAGNVLNNIAAGNRLVSVMDANGCVKSNNVFVGAPAALTLQVINQQPASCFGGSNGALTMQAGGGTGAYQYAINGGAYQSTPAFNILAAGTYTIAVQDANACTFSISATVTQPEELSLQMLSKTNILCAGNATGSMKLQATGGVGAYLYSLDGAAFQTNAYYGSLPAGNYTITVKDNNQCTGAFPVPLVDLYAPLTASLNAAAPATCADKGSITVTNVQGGLSPYNYSLDNASYTTDPLFSNLYNGDYTVYIKDANGCTITRSISPYGPVSMRGTLQLQPALCNAQNNGSIKVTNVTGGNNVYEYSLDGTTYQSSNEFLNLRAGVYQVHVRDVPYTCQVMLTGEVKEPAALGLQLINNIPVSCFNGNNGALTVQATGGTGSYAFSLNGSAFNTAASFTVLNAGNYTIQVRDANSCISQLAATVAQPSLLTAVITASRNISCFGSGDGEITINAGGGTTPYLYSIDGTNYQSNTVFAGLQKGSYTIQVKDNNGCMQPVTGNITEPAALQMQVVQTTDIACFGTATGQITIAASGGTGAYAFALNNLPAQGSGVFTNLTAGSYLLSVSDVNACSSRQTITLQQPQLLQLSKQVQQPTCSYGTDGSIAVTVSGGVTPYTYNWNNSSNTGNTLSNLGGGLYKVTVTDANGCQLQDSALLVQPTAMPLSVGFRDTVLCVGQSIIVDAGNPGASYSWVSDAGFSDNRQAVQLNKDGHYTVTVTTPSGCVAKDSFNITTSTSALKADFLLSSYGIIGDTVMVIDVSQPRPITHEWTLPQGAVDAGSAAEGTIRQLLFEQTGVYTIQMLVSLGECSDLISKTITILPKEQQGEADSLLGYRERLIKEITAYPNPNDGPFKVRVRLSKAANIQLKLISFNNGNVVTVKTAGGSDNYEIPFDTAQLPQGIYLVAVQVEKEYQVIRVLKL